MSKPDIDLAFSWMARLRAELSDAIDGGEECGGRDTRITKWIAMCDLAMGRQVDPWMKAYLASSDAPEEREYLRQKAEGEAARNRIELLKAEGRALRDKAMMPNTVGLRVMYDTQRRYGEWVDANLDALLSPQWHG